MIDVNILCTGLTRYKSRAFAFPVLRYNSQLYRCGINCRVYTDVSDQIDDCNLLLIQDNVVKHENGINLDLDDLHQYLGSVDSLVWVDTTDSTGTIHTEALSIVDRYYKKQLLKDRSRYLDPMYGSRLYTDFYHERFSADDRNGEAEEAYPAIQVQNRSYLDKLELAWNIGVIPNLPHDGVGWYILERLPDSVCANLPWDRLFGASPLWKSANSSREVDISGRFSTSYDRHTVEFHREHMSKSLGGRYKPEKVSTKDYWKEIRNAKILLSPFGWGEVCLRDFEGFLSGNVVLKPSMGHLETWPPLYEAGETYVEISWDMEDAQETVDLVLDQYDEYCKIAETGQKRYRKYLVGDTAAKQFVDHFEDLVVQ